MNSKAYKLPNGKKVIFEYDITGVGKITLECMDEIMSMIADIPQEDTVSRRYLLAEIDDLADEFSELDENGLHSERWCGIMDSKGVIVNTPSVSDRPQGEWIEFDTKWGRSLYYCTNCMETSEVPTAFGKPLYDFCPKCGAIMTGGNNV